MLAIASEIVLCLVIAAVLGIIVGYVIGKTHCPKSRFRDITPHDPHTSDDEGLDAGDDSDDIENKDDNADDETDVVSSDDIVSQAQDETEVSDEAPQTQPEQATDKSTEQNDGQEIDQGDDQTSDSNDSLEDTSGNSDRGTQELLLLDQPYPDRPQDDLTRIKGIGTKTQKLLNEAGIYYFEQIAAWAQVEASQIDEQISFHVRSDRDKWIEQAQAIVESSQQ